MPSVADDTRSLADDILSCARGRRRAIADMKSGVAGLRAAVAGFLTATETERRRRFRDTRDRLAGRRAELAGQTHEFLSQCDDEHCALAEELRQTADQQHRAAADEEAARRAAFLELHDRIGRSVGALVTTTREFLHDCGAQQSVLEDELRNAASDLRQQLASGDHGRLETFFRLHNQVVGRVAELAHEVHRQLEESRTNLLAARAVWDDLAAARCQ
jgi:hypothetical protein